jgi:hypothetical protein
MYKQLPLIPTAPTAGENLTRPQFSHLSAGDYRLAVGQHEFQSGQRLVVPGSPNNSVLLEQIERRAE